MKVGDRVKGLFHGVRYTGKIIDQCGTHSDMYQVEFDAPIKGNDTAVIFQHGDSIEPDKTIQNKIRGLEDCKITEEEVGRLGYSDMSYEDVLSEDK